MEFILNKYLENDILKIKLGPVLFVSFLIHLILIYAKVDFPNLSVKKKISKATEIQVFDLQQLEKFRNKTVPRQIVNSDQVGEKKKDPKTRFLGKSDQYYERQTIAKKVSSYQEAGKGNGSKLVEASPTPTVKDLGKKLTLSDLGSLGQAMAIEKSKPKAKKKKAPGLLTGKAGKKGLSASNDFVEDVSLGDFTRLNTVEYKYFGFYERIRRKLEQFWGASLQEKAKSFFTRGGRIPSNENFVTALTITLNDNGKIIDVNLNGSSGVKDLDDAAIDSFNNAGPFPNPPKGMIKNGIAKIKWTFVVRS